MIGLNTHKRPISISSLKSNTSSVGLGQGYNFGGVRLRVPTRVLGSSDVARRVTTQKQSTVTGHITPDRHTGLS